MNFSFFRKLTAYIRINGLSSLFTQFAYRVMRTPKFVLMFFIGFDSWHIHSFKERAYAVALVSYLNSKLDREDVLEIGCGLGDILSRLDYKSRVGLDYDEKVLRGARLLSKLVKGHIYYAKFDLVADNLPDEKYDAIIMCNWIHDIAPDFLRSKITSIISSNLKMNGELVIDCIDNKKYQFNHSVEDLTEGLDVSVKDLGVYPGCRRLVAIKNNNDN